MSKEEREAEEDMVGLRKEDAIYRSKWGVGVNRIAAGLR